MTRKKGTDYCIAPESLLAWFDAFADLGAGDRMFHIGEEASALDVLNSGIGFRDGQAQRVVILSSHESLLRDFYLGESLIQIGIEAYSQTESGVRVGLDKVEFKRALDTIGVATPCWGHLPTLSSKDRGILLKKRNATQSGGIRWFDGSIPGTVVDWFWEEFVYGCEYSIVAFIGKSGVTYLPVVWKGETQIDLTPPWKRLRICPDPGLSSKLEDSLIRETQRVLEFVNMWGFVEFEFVLDHDGRALLLEVNPRVSGTVRIAAMASNVKVFRFLAANNANLPPRLIAKRQGLEVPYAGVPFVSGDLRVIASSRITMAADTGTELIELARTKLTRQNEIIDAAARRLGV